MNNYILHRVNKFLSIVLTLILVIACISTITSSNFFLAPPVNMEFIKTSSFSSEQIILIKKFIEAIRKGKFQQGNIVDLRNLPSNKEIILIGDLHARIDNLERILNNRTVILKKTMPFMGNKQSSDQSLLEKVKNKKAVLIMLGDAIHYDFYNEYSDEEINGFSEEEQIEVEKELSDMNNSINIMQRIMELKIQNPDYFYFLLGNHDNPFEDCGKWHTNQSEVYRKECQRRYGNEYLKLYRKFIDNCPVILIANGLVATHAGPVKRLSIEEVQYMKKDNPSLFHIFCGRFNETPDFIFWSYGRQDVKYFLKSIGQPEAIFIVGHLPRILPKISFHKELMKNHHIIYAGKDITGYALFKEGKIDFIQIPHSNVEGTGLYLKHNKKSFQDLRTSN